MITRRCAGTIAAVALSLVALTGCASRPERATPSIEHPASIPNAPIDALNPHCLFSCPRNTELADVIIRRSLYTLANNGETKFADWVAYVVRPEWIGSDRPRRWRADPDLDPSITLEPPDFDGADADFHYERGHQAPLQSFGAAPAWAETNYLSNITPQNSNLNGGRWRLVEAAERRLAQRIQGPVYVLTGPLYEAAMPSMRRADEPHRVPSGYWKVIALADGRAVGFIFDNAPARSAPYCDGRRTIAEIEQRSGLDLLGEAPLGRLDVEIGCAA